MVLEYREKIYENSKFKNKFQWLRVDIEKTLMPCFYCILLVLSLKIPRIKRKQKVKDKHIVKYIYIIPVKGYIQFLINS